jgi:NIMA-interacting peptidyl-prolyl cis-trans isomerase 1
MASANASTASPAGVVLTGQQDAWQQGGGPGKYWEDKPNAGYSGTPLWKLHAERDAAIAAANAVATVKIPDGFKKHKDHWYWSDKRQVFWNVKDGEFYVKDLTKDRLVQLYEAKSFEIAISAGFICHEKAAQVRHVIVKELPKAAQALRISIGHLDLPCAMYALYEGHRGSASGNVCTDFCSKHLHGKLLPKLASFRGYWEDERLEAAMRESFEELDSNFAEKHPESKEGCCAAVALVTGSRLVVASLGDISCVLCHRTGEVVRLVQAHAIPDPDLEEEEDSEDEEQARAAAEAAARPLRFTRSFGDLDFKGVGKVPQLQATPEVKVIHLEHKHHGFAFICRSLYASIGGSPAVTTVFRRSAGRPRMASGTLVDAAVQWLGQVGPEMGLASVVAFFDKAEAPDTPAAKKARTTETTQVRLRHILLKHKECKSVIDKVRNKQVKRTRGDAERLLRAVLEECEGDKGHKIFSTRVRELSECQSSLKAGDLAGDLGWVKKGTSKMGEVFEAAGFALQKNQLSDLVDTEQGIHIILRTA